MPGLARESELAPSPRKAFLVSHTHWDREWYLTFHRFRVNLVEVVNRVLDALDHDSEFRHFVLDGQSVVLEDYLEVAPHQLDRVNRLVGAGRLAVGPWYVLPDEFLVSGEATVRNLMFGRRAAPLARVQNVGYMPDSFGHLAQMPQILQLVGIDSFVFTRGMGAEAEDPGWVFRWAAPDGSEVLAVNQCGGYCNAGGLGFAEIWHAHTQRKTDPAQAVAKVEELFAKMSVRPGGDPALLNNGCDHFTAQQDFSGMLAALRKAWPGTDFVHGSFEDFLRAVRNETPDQDRLCVTGELLAGRDHMILSGVWSTRMPLKQQNEECQNLLTRYIEPLAAAAFFQHCLPWPAGLFDAAWKELLRNHPHDSICGCSTDAVHQDMDTRFAAVRQTAEQYLSRLMDRLTPMFAAQEKDDRATVIGVANPLPFVRDEVVERLVVLQPLGYNLDNLHLLDEAGHKIPFEIVGRRFLERFWGIDYRSELFCGDQLDLLDTYLRRFGDRIIGTETDAGTKDCFLHIRFLARGLPAVGHVQYRLVDDAPQSLPAAVPNPVTACLAADSATLENEHLRVSLHSDGTFDLEDKSTGHRYPGLNMLEDAEDIGDEYDYCPAEINGLFFAAGCEGKVKLGSRSDLAATAEATFRFDLPRSVERDRKSRHPRTTPTDVTVRLILRAGSRRLDIETDFNNRAFDHRLRAWFPTGIRVDEVVSDGQFMLNCRPVTRPTGEDWDQPAPPTWPQQDFSFLHDDEAGLAVFNRGLPEFETFGDQDGGIIYALTLLRCVDWLSRDDFPTRCSTNAGPTLYTPDAQCIGRHTFRYAVMPFAGDPFAADVKGESERYRVPPPTHQGVADGMITGGGSLVRKTNPQVAVTAIKKAERGDLLVIRMYNQADTEVTETLYFETPVLDAEKIDLLEGPLWMDRAEPAVTHGGLRLQVPLVPCEIATVAIAFDSLAPEESS